MYRSASGLNYPLGTLTHSLDVSAVTPRRCPCTSDTEINSFGFPFGLIGRLEHQAPLWSFCCKTALGIIWVSYWATSAGER
jgi:hypothetical protein